MGQARAGHRNRYRAEQGLHWCESLVAEHLELGAVGTLQGQGTSEPRRVWGSVAGGLLGSLVEVGRGMLPSGQGIRVVVPGRGDRYQG